MTHDSPHGGEHHTCGAPAALTLETPMTSPTAHPAGEQAVPTDQQRAWYAEQSSQFFEEITMYSGGKRCGVQWTPWMGDWFTSWSPRNGNNHAEGTWDHWVDLAIAILQDPLTELVRPEARAAVADLVRRDFYDESDRHLTDDELMLRFAPAEEATR